MKYFQIFVKVKRRDENAMSKIKAIKGDVGEPNMGLSEEDQKILEEEVSIVFHVAASVR